MTYPGGKAASGTYQQIINLIPPHRVYIEPFLGGGAIARAKRPAAINILIDLDPAAIAAFGDSSGAIAIPGDAYRYPSPGMTIPDPIAAPDDGRAHRHSRRDRPSPPNPAILASIAAFDDTASNSDAAARCFLLTTDALAFLRAYPFQGDEFIYCDPPYLMSVRSSQRRIYRHELTETDHIALLDILKALPCKVMLSGYQSQLYTDALTGDASECPQGRWHTHTFESITRSGKTATEWLWMNYPRPIALHQYDFLGSGFRERERIKRKKSRWVQRLQKMPILEKQAILAAIQETL